MTWCKLSHDPLPYSPSSQLKILEAHLQVMFLKGELSSPSSWKEESTRESYPSQLYILKAKFQISAAKMSGAPSSPILYSYDKVLFKKWQAEISVIKCTFTSPAMDIS